MDEPLDLRVQAGASQAAERPMISIYRIEQLHAEGKQAQRDGLPFSACPYPGHTEHEARWQWGYIAAMLESKEAA